MSSLETRKSMVFFETFFFKKLTIKNKRGRAIGRSGRRERRWNTPKKVRNITLLSLYNLYVLVYEYVNIPWRLSFYFYFWKRRVYLYIWVCSSTRQKNLSLFREPRPRKQKLRSEDGKILFILLRGKQEKGFLRNYLGQAHLSITIDLECTSSLQTLVWRWQNSIYTERKTRKRLFRLLENIFGPSPFFSYYRS